MKQRSEYMTNQQKTQMEALARKRKDKMRTHQNCMEATGVARPGKTRADKANGSWKSKQQRNAANAARRGDKK